MTPKPKNRKHSSSERLTLQRFSTTPGNPQSSENRKWWLERLVCLSLSPKTSEKFIKKAKSRNWDRKLIFQKPKLLSWSLTSWGSVNALYLLARIIEVVGIIYVYEPTTTVGSLVPNRDCNNVFNPETNSMVCTTLAFSICGGKKEWISWRIHSLLKNQCDWYGRKRNDFCTPFSSFCVLLLFMSLHSEGQK